MTLYLYYICMAGSTVKAIPPSSAMRNYRTADNRSIGTELGCIDPRQSTQDSLDDRGLASGEGYSSATSLLQISPKKSEYHAEGT